MPVDVHSHLIPEGYLRVARQPGNVYGETIAHDPKTGLDVLTTKSGIPYHLVRGLINPEAAIAEQDKMELTFSLVSPPPTILHDWLEPAAGREHCRMVNEGMAAVQRRHPRRFAGLGTVPMQDPESAVAELEHAVLKLGLYGIAIATNVAGRNLDEPDFHPFFRRAAELGAVVFMHPWYVAGVNRMARYHLANAVGNPMDLAIAVGSLIFGGVLDACPGLKLIVVHAGGAVPYIIGRMDRAWRIRPEAQGRIQQPPSSYLPRLWYDTIAHNPEALHYLLRTVGIDRILLGSDAPFHIFDMGDPTPVEGIRALRLPADDEARLTDGNARALLEGIPTGTGRP